MSMRKIYQELAKKHGVSVKEIRQDMQAALTQRNHKSLPEQSAASGQDPYPGGSGALSGGRIKEEQGMNCAVFYCEKMRGSGRRERQRTGKNHFP